MEKKIFKIEINADAKKVWYVLWDDFYYRSWTSAFFEGSYAVTDNWKEKSTVHFLTPEGKGMYSTVTENKPYETMFFTHIGNVVDFQEQPIDDEARQWTGATENYTLVEKNGKTILMVEIDIDEKSLEYFEKVFPVALQKVKELAEHFFITVQTTVQLPIDKAWEIWNNPADINNWCTATEEWHTTNAENDLRVGGKTKCRMEAKDGSMGFDFEGTYTAIEPNQRIEYNIADGRKVKIVFENSGDSTKITESFEPEGTNPLDMQRDGWQAILNNFKKYAEKTLVF